MALTATIGLEIHAELKTQTKMFCASKNDPDESRANTNVCPVCMGHPGTLPVPNYEAVRHVLRVGHAVGGTIADFTEFDRKNYFYPDIPKAYQISQYKHPMVAGGNLDGVQLTRIHLEEDTARSAHDSGEESLVDFNRAGVPLMELVTEPVLRSGDEAISFARELQLLLKELGAGDANMEKGEMRVEANISVGEDGRLGTKVEVKNLNSFRSVGRAIDYEIKRQADLIKRGQSIAQETRGWNEAKQVTFSQRAKEGSEDYRYFPDPDLPKMFLSEVPEFDAAALQSTLPELPWDRRRRYVESLGMNVNEADIFIYRREFSELLEKEILPALGHQKNYLKTAINYVTSDLAGLLNKEGYSVENVRSGYVDLIRMVVDGVIGSRGAKDTLEIMAREGGDPRKIAEKRGVIQKSDIGELESVVKEVIDEHPSVAEEYRGGKSSSLQYLVGQIMKSTGGAANPKVAAELLKKQLNK